MKGTKITSALVFAIIAVGQVASAQVFSPIFPYGNTGSCVSVTRDLTIGSKGSDVTSLQRFIVNRNYPGGGSWMITGYFGAATRAGVINFQIDQNLPQTGWVDAVTRAAISQVTCVTGQGGYGYVSPTSYPSVYPINTPTYIPPQVTLPCGGLYPYTSGVTNTYSSCPNSGPFQVSSLSPQSGGVGSNVTVYGSGFSTRGNSVRFGNGIITGLNSPDGRSVSFTVPTTLSGYGSGQVVVGSTYSVSVITALGQTSNALPFTVTSLGAYGAPSISGVSGPNTISVNTSGTWTLSINNQFNSNYTSVSVNWGDPVYGAYASAPQQANGSQTLSFSHSYTQAGSYTIVFTATNAGGQSATASVTVNVTGSASGLSISYLSPTAGRV